MDNFKKNYEIIKKRYDFLEKQEEIQKLINGYANTRDATIKNILEILKDGKFIGSEGELLEKGSIACELNNCHPLLLADLLEERFFDKCTMPEIVAILAVFIDEKVEYNQIDYKDLKMPHLVLDNIDYLWSGLDYYKKLEVQRYIRTDCDYNINLDLVEPAYHWAMGKDIGFILTNYPMYSGNFSRSILRINSLCDDLLNIAQLTNNIVLQKNLEGCTEMLIRDIVTVNSLYIDK